jgi:hypothetical protein
MHDYHIFEPDWYIEFEKFGTDWDICVHQIRHMPEQASIRCNGWRAESIPGYPEIPNAMTIPWDIDCFIPYMPIQGAYWVAKKYVMLEQPLDERLIFGDSEDIEWSSRVVPGWKGEKIDQIGFACPVWAYQHIKRTQLDCCVFDRAKTSDMDLRELFHYSESNSILL